MINREEKFCLLFEPEKSNSNIGFKMQEFNGKPAITKELLRQQRDASQTHIPFLTIFANDFSSFEVQFSCSDSKKSPHFLFTVSLAFSDVCTIDFVRLEITVELLFFAFEEEPDFVFTVNYVN